MPIRSLPEIASRFTSAYEPDVQDGLKKIGDERLYLRFLWEDVDEPDFLKVKDQSVNGYHATYTDLYRVGGVGAPAAFFSTDTPGLKVDHNTNLNLNGSWSIVLVANDQGGEGPIMFKGDPESDNGYSLRWTKTGKLIFRRSGVDHASPDGTILNRHRIIVISNDPGDVMRFYADGVEVGTAPAVTATNNTSLDLFIGSNNSSVQTGTFHLQELRFLPYAIPNASSPKLLAVGSLRQTKNISKFTSAFWSSYINYVDDEVRRLHKQVLPGTRTGGFLDRYGSMFGVQRRLNETDAQFYVRIKSRVRRYVGGTSPDDMLEFISGAMGVAPTAIAIYENRTEASTESPPSNYIMADFTCEVAVSLIFALGYTEAEIPSFLSDLQATIDEISAAGVKGNIKTLGGGKWDQAIWDEDLYG